MPGPKYRDTERVGGWLRPVNRRDEQTQKFEDALCKRLGLSPDEVVQGIRWTIQDDEDFGTVQPTLHLPAEELREMWRAAAPPPPPQITDVKKGDTIRVHGVDGYQDIVVGDVEPSDDGMTFTFTPVWRSSADTLSDDGREGDDR